MNIKNVAVAGSLESNDCLVTIQPADDLIIDIESIVFSQFGEQIKEVIEQTLSENKVKSGHIICDDKGALDYTIKARLITAIERSSK